MKLRNTITYEIKKSKFIAYAYEINSTEEFKQIYANLKKEHPKARHIPYAYILFNTAGKSDDKEPSNTAGMPIYNLLLRSNKTNLAIFIVRYFGGVKLGAGGLTRAYMKACKDVLEQL